MGQKKRPVANTTIISKKRPRRNSRITGFYRLVHEDRLSMLEKQGFLDQSAVSLLRQTGTVLGWEKANTMIENVVGVFELPLGMGLNFKINERDYVVPMAVEEPSILAAVGHAATIFRDAGGIYAEAEPSIMTGQIQIVDIPDLKVAITRLETAKKNLIHQANELEPGMLRRGGGALDIEIRQLKDKKNETFLVVHLYVDVCDAMGANLINTMVEGLADEIELLTGGKVFLRILSNLTDRRRAAAQVSIPIQKLAWKEFTGEQVANGIIRASEFAEIDPYRAATHNKGIMNGIDAAAIAAGQDWRAIEAGAHAYAASSGSYKPLAKWWREENMLYGKIEMPMAVGIVGGPTRLHPTVKTCLKILGVQSAAELACVLVSVGLAQNFSAIKALSTTGIQRGHMALHARSVAATAGATGEKVEKIARQLIQEQNIKVERARELLKKC